MTEERVKLFNDRLKGQLIPQIIWLDSHDYLMGVGVHASDGVHYKDDTNPVSYTHLDVYKRQIIARPLC